MEDALNDPAQIRQLLAERPPLPWADQTQAEHDAELARTWGARTTANRRILQGVEDDDGAIMHLLPGPIAWCDDPLAANVGEGGRCTYDCEMLQDLYFPAEESRCFRYDAANGGWPAALLVRKQVWSDNDNTIVVPNDENWIIQGTLGPDGVPVQLDARISSGTAVDFSEASIVVRHVRFSGQRAPLDPHTAAHDDGIQAYIHSPFFSNDETRLGGAFSYDGGGLNPEVHTPKLVFEHVVFDHNQAVCAAAVWIAGRAGTMAGLDLVVDGCLFFRNVAAYFVPGLMVWNTMPGAHLVNNSDFLEGSAFMAAPIHMAGLDAKVGVQGRRNTYVIANSHFDAGGLWTYVAGGPFVTTYFAPTADGTIHDALFERVTVVDINAASTPQALSCFSIGLRETHCAIRECRVARAVGLEGAQQTSAEHAMAVIATGAETMEVSRLTLEASGSFVDQSRGEGAMLVGTYGGTFDFVPTALIRDSKFLRNQAAYGGAISVGGSDEADVVVERCFFEVGASRVDRDTVGSTQTTWTALLITCVRAGQCGDSDRRRHFYPRPHPQPRARQYLLRQRRGAGDLGADCLVRAHPLHCSVGRRRAKVCNVVH